MGVQEEQGVVMTDRSDHGIIKFSTIEHPFTHQFRDSVIVLL